jgi:hypothetical protein
LTSNNVTPRARAASRAVAALLALCGSAAGCASSPPPEHPQAPPAAPAASTGNTQPDTPPSDQGEEAEAARIDREARIRLTTSLAHGLRLGAALWMASHPDVCPTPDDIVAAKLVSPHLTTRDAWNSPYRIVCDEANPKVTSPGPDGKDGTADDIVASDR